MKFLLVFATTQGQTAKIVRHVADRLGARGHQIELVEAGPDAGLEPGRFDAAILAGSIHVGRYQPELLRIAQRHAATLSEMPGLFLSVSLTAAGDDPAEHAELDRLAQGFLADAGWQGAKIAQIAGALKFSAYGFFEYWAMRWIARQRNYQITGREDIELTDWRGLDAVIEGFVATVASRRKPAR